MAVTTLQLMTVINFTSQDLDTTDATLQTTISSIYNDYFYH